jgi:hypothetical protein
MEAKTVSRKALAVNDRKFAKFATYHEGSRPVLVD